MRQLETFQTSHSSAGEALLLSAITGRERDHTLTETEGDQERLTETEHKHF